MNIWETARCIVINTFNPFPLKNAISSVYKRSITNNFFFIIFISVLIYWNSRCHSEETNIDQLSVSYNSYYCFNYNYLFIYIILRLAEVVIFSQTRNSTEPKELLSSRSNCVNQVKLITLIKFLYSENNIFISIISEIYLNIFSG